MKYWQNELMYPLNAIDLFFQLLYLYTFPSPLKPIKAKMKNKIILI